MAFVNICGQKTVITLCEVRASGEMLLQVVVLLVLGVSLSNAVLPDIGVANYSCSPALMRKSRDVPTNVNSVRPADIKVVMALGDSLTVSSQIQVNRSNYPFVELLPREIL
ncbi:hypothetical protein COOONC_17747 [Cooperia oncophora]